MSCGGPSADTDELPQWVKSINAELVSNFDLSKCPRLEQTVASSETIDDLPALLASLRRGTLSSFMENSQRFMLWPPPSTVQEMKLSE